MGEHTKGPWKVEFHNSKGFDDLSAAGDWTLHGADGTQIAIESVHPNNVNDLRLIASAPDLLRVVADIVAMADMAKKCDFHAFEVWTECRLIDAARAAIARAEGEK